MAQITHDKDGRQIVPVSTLRAILRRAGERCYCAPDGYTGDWDAGRCPQHRRDTQQ